MVIMRVSSLLFVAFVEKADIFTKKDMLTKFSSEHVKC